MTTADHEPDFEFSPLGGRVTRDGVNLQVHIYRVVGEDAGWTLEVVDAADTSTVWDDRFETDALALDEFDRTLDENGVEAFTAEPDETIH